MSCNYRNSVAKRVIRQEEERKEEEGEGGKEWRDGSEGKCGEEEQREGIKHRAKQSRRQLSVSRAKIAGQFPPLRACANLFLLRSARPSPALPAAIFTVASPVRRTFLSASANRPHVRSDCEYTKAPGESRRIKQSAIFPESESQ